MKLTGTDRQTDRQADSKADGQDHVLSQADTLTKNHEQKYKAVIKSTQTYSKDSKFRFLFSYYGWWSPGRLENCYNKGKGC